MRSPLIKARYNMTKRTGIIFFILGLLLAVVTVTVGTWHEVYIPSFEAYAD